MNKFLGLTFSALVVLASADKGFEQSQYSSGGAGGFGGSSAAGGFGGSSGGFGGSSGGFGSSAGGFGGGDAEYASDAAGGSLEEAIPGTPGEDYPIFAEVPETSFLCDGQADGGYYADPEAECQAFHICANDGSAGLTKYSFLCPNGTLFQQQYFVCDWWFNVDCSTAEEFYSLNDEIAAERAANSPDGGAGQYQGGAGGQSGGARRGGGGSSGRRGGSSGSKASASSPRGSYSSPDSFASGPSYTSPAEFGGNGFGSADAGYGAPGGFGGSDSGFGSADGGYGAPGLGGYSRRNARELPLNEISEFEQDSDVLEDFDY